MSLNKETKRTLLQNLTYIQYALISEFTVKLERYQYL